MEWVNYHHLLYFWVAARHESVTRASEELMLRQPTVSAQIKRLEQSLGHQLFDRTGRRLRLTEVGRTVFDYAEEIFTLGRELMDTIRLRPTERALRLRVGIASVVPKLVAEILLRRATDRPEAVHLVVREGHAEELELQLAAYHLDVVIADAPLSPRVKVKAFSHRLGTCGVTLFGKGALTRKLRSGFPESLTGAPMLLPGADTVLRRDLDHWFEERDIRPEIVGEFDDSALMKVFGQRGLGVFPSPDWIADEVCRQYGVRPLGGLPGVEESFYAVTLARRIRNPLVAALTGGDAPGEEAGETGLES